MVKLRTQYDGRQLGFSTAGGIDCSGDRMITRQEQRDDADIEMMMKRFGLGAAPAPQRVPRFDTWDESIDLHSAYVALDNVTKGYKKLPREVRKEFPTPLIFVNAIASGELAHYIEREKKREAQTDPAAVTGPSAAIPPKGQADVAPQAAKPVTG